MWVNGKPAGVVVAHPFRVDVTGLLKPGGNELAIEVTNLSANRIRDLDRRGVDWKKFHDINLVNHMYKPFDASVGSETVRPAGPRDPASREKRLALKRINPAAASPRRQQQVLHLAVSVSAHCVRPGVSEPVVTS